MFVFLAACRYGFATAPKDGMELAGDGAADGAPDDAPHPDGPSGKADAAGVVDAGLAIDSLPGFGGYTLTDSTAPYTLLAGTPVPGFAVAADDENYSMALPFAFKLYGIAYSSLTISMNGFVTFDAPVTGAETQLNDCPLDATPPGAMIALFWDDLYANSVAPVGALSYRFDGATPDRRLTIEWRDMDAYYPAGMNSFTQGVRVTQALVLHETGTIEMHYGPRTPPQYPNKDCGADRHRGCSATVGLEASGSQLFDNLQCGTAAGPGPGYTPLDEGRLFTLVPM